MSHNNAIRRVAFGAALVFTPACAMRAPAVTTAPDDASCRLVVDTTAQRVPPRRLSGPDPKYPGHLMRSGVQGQVMLQFVVGCNGLVRPETVEVLSFTREDFVKPAVASTVGTKFAPALIDGVPAAVRVKLTVRFTITNSRAASGR